MTYETLSNAFQSLSKKPDMSGSDGVLLSELPAYWEAHKNVILEQIRSGIYVPSPIQIGNSHSYIFSSIDQLILCCLNMELSQKYDSLFSPLCFFGRNRRGEKDALSQIELYLNNQHMFCAAFQINQYYESVSLPVLERKVNQIIEEPSVRALLHQYLYLKLEYRGQTFTKTSGLIPNMELTPFLSNLYLNDLDQALLKKNISYIHYGNQYLLYFPDKPSAEEAFLPLQKILTQEYPFSLNLKHCGIFPSCRQKFLDYTFSYDEKEKKYIARKTNLGKMKEYRQWESSSLQVENNQYHLLNDGILSKRDYTLLFENGINKCYLPVETTHTLNVYSNMVFKKTFFQFASEKNLEVNMFDKYGQKIGSFVPAGDGARTRTLLKQVEYYLDSDKRFAIAQAMEIAALHNLRANLRYYSRHLNNLILNENIAKLTALQDSLKASKDLQHLMLIEARAREIYYSMFNYIIQKEGFKFTKRTRRPPKDAINALISFGNVWLYNQIATEINKTSLDIRIGFIHAANRRNESLNLDIADIFKPLVVDRAIFTVINRNMIRPELHFETTSESGVYLNKEGKRIFLQELRKKMLQRNTQKNKSSTNSQKIQEEIRKIYRAVEQDEKYKGYKYY